MTGTAPPIKVLLVDDEEDFLESTAKVLTRRGLNVVTASSGTEALARIAADGLDVVVLDVKMPGMDGEQVFNCIRRDRPELPVIMLTGHGSIPQAFQMSKGGVVDYLAKPCEADPLAEKIRQAAGRGRSPRSGDEHASPHPERSISVLLVDDEEDLLESLARVLVRRGMEVATARSGELALEALGSREIDVVVLDVKMPGMDGLETLRRIKAGHPDREVILLTGHPTVDNAVTGVRLGAMEYVTKPPDVVTLSMLIHRAYNKRMNTLEELRRDAVRGALDRRPE